MSKTAELKAEREARKAQRAAAKLEKQRALDEAVAAAKEALMPPPSLGTWGVVQTRCWMTVHANIARQSRLKRKSTERLCQLNRLMQEIPSMSPERCNEITMELKGGAQ